MKITLVSYDLWGYNDFIAKQLREMNCEVTHIDTSQYNYVYKSKIERVKNFFLKLFFNKNIKKDYQKQQLVQNVSAINHQDAILIINPIWFPPKVLQTLRNKTSKLMAFCNDSLSKVPLPENHNELFDEIFVFDPADVTQNRKLITNYIYAPLLSLEEQSVVAPIIYTVQSGDKKRLKQLIHFYDYFSNEGFITDFYVKGSRKYNAPQEIHFLKSKILKLPETNQQMKNALAVLDIVKENQNGLSFRVMECLGLRKKLITTNQSIKEYDFYNPNNILVVDGDSKSIEIPPMFFKTPYEDIDEAILAKYTLPYWVKTVFLNKK